MRPFPRFAELRDAPYQPRLHPNGFIQLDLSDGRRLHVWTDTPIRACVPAAPIHDHVFDLDSDVYFGTLIDRRFQAVADPTGEYEMHGVVCYKVGGKDARLERLDQARYRLVTTAELRIAAPSSYTIPAFELHASENVGFAATVITMTMRDAERPARIACHHDRVPQGVFNRDGGPEERALLWTHIERACALV